ncbi:putative adenylate cyclase [Planktothrix agardhii CCAP 1459/11A]|uniref:Adenylate cyclase n=3 Tax=Planktothrix agardhii TaxID=1160 RepID=A0A073CKQ0_PLAA1|nr:MULTISPECIES: adenylate/guanylate cyclase domain-containing protein [Planktothrix]MCF3565090.1 adenylate/guanylate cyclase domain-containing protein [Planktothrix agardhii 1807]MCF3573362.1 adenylate/guanylate cyclase domain-containing protein [Planktothrix agardhii 1805]MCF3584624.1 adenylate/guanylate cyclase domain-containing protein [Planktothrix agardhii 1803]MCF3588451.1 adenylate/guanylate cyclase domain-containing protein [Planktothrix agardhii 1029]MCF3597044.1 adenylate/guanylate 
MSEQMKLFFKLLNARLSRNIAIWVFLSLVFIEVLILIPSVYQYQQQLLRQFPAISSNKIAWIIETYPYSSNSELLKQLSHLHHLNPDILGGAVYRTTGELIGQFGEPPVLTFSQAIQGKTLYLRQQNGDRYDVSCNVNPMNNKYVIIIRHDASDVQTETYAYILRIAGLVLIIAFFVTSSTLFVLGKNVILPILKLRLDLIEAGKAIVDNKPVPRFYSNSIQRNDELGDVIATFQTMFEKIYQATLERNQAEADLRLEKDKSEKLLLNILPLAIAEKLKKNQGCIADRFEETTILFADLTDFTGISSRSSPTQIVTILNEIFSEFDRLADKYELEKIKTIGDAYMVVGGIPIPKPNHAQAIAEMALEMQQIIQKFRSHDNQLLNLRIGINTGPVVAGVIGLKKFSYDLWGDAVNIASRMESQGIPGQIQVSHTTYQKIKDSYLLEERGIILVKGKGEMRTYWLTGKQ